ncbi:MAG: amino acid adenylation domain-containing protein, partial [Verrucomicrobiota bacterium]
NGAVANPGCRLQELPWWTEPERRRLLVDWNQTQRDYPRNACIHGLFEGHVRCAPERVAVVFGTRQLTFSELNTRANQLAHRLRQLGLKAGDFVGISAERSLELIIGLVAILKAGGAYAALDPNLPALRLADLLNDLGCNVVLTQQRHGNIFSEASHLANPQARLQTFWLDSDWPTLAGESTENLSCEINALHPAYVSFTSGSTGRPKGVCVPHRGVVRLVRNTNYANFSPDEVFLQLAPVAFDASTLEIWGALLNGARVVVLPPGTPTLTELAETIQEQRVTIAFLTSGYFNQIIDEKPEALKPLRQILTGGEALSLPHAHKARVLLPGCRLIHCYGPTENTTFTTCHDIPANFDGKSPVPIGRPISNTECYVLDSARQPVPIGVPGELYVGGDGLALGYLNRPELTAERFIEHPFRAGARLYKTGDLVRYLADGNIEFCGRLDFQLKIRGFRVEPAEIEAALLQHPEASQCIVVARADASGQKHLVAYIVPRGMPSLEPAEWQNYLRQRLPEYMVPANVVTLAELPLLPNGKVNRAALPLPKAVTVSSDRRLVPLDATEQQLLTLWQEVLATRPMGLNENFFALGGHSLLAVRLLARIEKSLGKKLSVAVLFQNPTIEQLAKLLRDEHPAKAGSAIVEIQAGGTQRPLFLVHGVGGGMFWGYANLARHLGPDQPVFALQSRSANGEAEFETIEAMAQSYLENVRAFQPSGPYYLGGYCFGGIVAFEMARRLQQQGEEVALLALINSAPPNSSYTKPGWRPSLAYSFARNACVRVVSSLRRPPEERRALFSWRAKSLAHRLRQKFFVPAGSCSVSLENWVDLSDVPENERALWRTHICALKHYQPQLYRGVVTLFRSPVHLLFCSFDSHYGWRELATGGVTMRIIPGAHESIMQEPRVQLLATELRACLQTAQAKTR